jgi:predicted site-specific integrase-resolvase
MQPFLLTIQQMALKLGVHPQTLRRWERHGIMPKPERTLGNHRRYRTTPIELEALTVGDARVSSNDQKEDLLRQKAAVTSQAGKPVDLVISDLGSGLNYKKAGFRRLLLLILQGKVKELALTHKDRLLRFGSEIIFQICQFYGVKITILPPTNRTWNSSAPIWWKS